MSLDLAHDPVDVRPTTRIAAFFDVDNTLLPGSASELRFFRYLWRHDIVGWRETVRSVAHLLRHMPPVSYQPLRVRKLYLEGKSPEVLDDLAERFSRAHLIPALSRQALARLESHREAGHEVVLVTGSLENLILPLARHLGVETVIAARLVRDACGYTGHVYPPLPYGEGKRALIEAWSQARSIHLPSSYAYGDSPGDVALLEVVGNPLVVNPIRGMEQVAQRRNWSVIRWE
ncbi:hypothetical protein YTPLAS18_01420 [Nitrospira sp.]|nr:hypothetical protein YTPLAS18_01420 [Nitrospira sp.]